MAPRDEITWSPWYQVTSLPVLGDYIQVDLATDYLEHQCSHEGLVVSAYGTDIVTVPVEPPAPEGSTGWKVDQWRKRLIGRIDETEEEKELELT